MAVQVKPLIFGASGFIGRHLVDHLGLDHCLPVSRNIRHPAWRKEDLFNLSANSFADVSTVINLAYATQCSADENIQMAQNLIKYCLQSNVSRLIHCSTAVVVGNNAASHIDEATVCHPTTIYEKTKYTIENMFLQAANSHLKVYILRPTAVIGPNGQNLKKLVNALRHGRPAVNFLRAALFGQRPLNLVPVKDVVRALQYLTETKKLSSGIYICSADDDPYNRFDAVEVIIRSLIGKKMPIKPIRCPRYVLNILLLSSRSGSGRFANRYYASDKLLATGFQRSVSIANAVSEFVLSELVS